MRAGLLREKISIIAPASTARSTDGAPIVTYATVLSSAWAQVTPLGGREAFQGDYRWADSDMRFLIRYTSIAIEPRYSVVYAGSTYNIDAVVNSSNDKRELVIMAHKST
jgi:SPP1 family predicted phage head-tail adaptor